MFCTTCKIIARKDTATEHCSHCNYCMEGYDHHCPWSSKCIARKNKKVFMIMMVLTFVVFVYMFLGGLYVTTENDNLVRHAAQ